MSAAVAVAIDCLCGAGAGVRSRERPRESPIVVEYGRYAGASPALQLSVQLSGPAAVGCCVQC
jgi:hypothetical protein